MKTVFPARLEGDITIQPSKSVLHRLIICAALATGESEIRNVLLSDDISTTLSALAAMGFCEYEIDKDRCVIRGGLQKPTEQVIDCGESGSTLRFLIPLAFDGQRRVFIGRGRLMQRPMLPYEKLFAKCGYCKTETGIEMCGTLRPGTFELPGDVSSQFVSGLLYALPRLGRTSKIKVNGTLESAPYVALTRQCQALFGVNSIVMEKGFKVKGGQAYRPADVCAEGDYSHAAFFAAAAAIGGNVTFRGLKKDSLQGDKAIFNIIQLMGADVKWDGNIVTVVHSSLKPVELDVSDIPDLVPVLAVLGCAANGKTKLLNAARLRFKESDRLHAMATELEKLGANIVEYEDSLVINGTGELTGGQAHTHGDHRIAMALAVASCIAKEAILLDEPDVVKKSAPRFYEEFSQLGGRLR
ncbi:3-phosphoshikimate 1-carboxyvinyltransferase [Christensenellaceae bacterium OttesenSCG-928-K19]|nr:3-phosphoshikimate 1-carboxyvinyltransferase [Christensenellaceae bacterium OttesenSCG-928-K19]